MQPDRAAAASRGPSAALFGSDPAGVQAMLAAIVDSADDAIVSKDLNATIMSWNTAAERIFGYTAEETIGRSITMLLPPERRHEEDIILATLRRGERIAHFETVRVRKDGRRIDVSISVSPIRDSTGAIVGAAKIARDITRRKEMEAERDRLLASERAARAEAESANRAKDEFLSVVSHELRTPLAAMLGWISVLRQGRLSPERVARALDTIERSGRVQAALIDDLLDVSRIIGGRLRLTLRPTRLAPILHAAVEAVRPDAVAAGVTLTAAIDTDLLVNGDDTRLQQVIANVLGNAIKFTPEGGRVDVRLERIGDEARLTMRDTGRGIPPALLPHVFEPFRQGDDVSSRRTRGLGLGLAIVRELVHRHGGSVVVDSAGEGLGTTVTVTIPALPAGAGVEREGNDTRLDGVRILVVDDDHDVREGLRAVLEDRGALVLVATSAGEARRYFAAVRPDVLVSDIRLPGEDGYALLRAVRDGDSAPGVPAVAITAYEADESSERAFAAGFHAHFGKPFDPDALIDTIATLANGQKAVS
jgi:PAS domain S-box-containing protein